MTLISSLKRSPLQSGRLVPTSQRQWHWVSFSSLLLETHTRQHTRTALWILWSKCWDGHSRIQVLKNNFSGWWYRWGMFRPFFKKNILKAPNDTDILFLYQTICDFIDTLPGSTGTLGEPVWVIIAGKCFEMVGVQRIKRIGCCGVRMWALAFTNAAWTGWAHAASLKHFFEMVMLFLQSWWVKHRYAESVLELIMRLFLHLKGVSNY